MSAVDRQLAGQAVRGQCIDGANIAGRLEGNRRELRAFREGGERTRQIASAERVYDDSRQVCGTQSRDEWFGDVNPCFLVVAVRALELVAVPSHHGRIEPSRN